MLNICFNNTFYNSFKIAKNQSLIRQSKILLIQEDLLLNNMNFNKYTNTISNYNDLTVWCSASSPKELYCLYFLVNKFRNNNIEVAFIDQNDYLKYSSSENVYFKDIPYFMEHRTKLSQEEKNKYSQNWLEILEQKGDLLVITNGKLKKVDSCFYDNKILNFVNDTWLYVYEAIGNFISFSELDIKDDFILNRLINLEKLDLVEINFNHDEIYNSKIRKKYK